LSADRKPVWVELLSRQDEVLARHRAEFGPNRAEVRLGRAYDNDVIIDDPYVAARHIRIVRDEAGELYAEDLGSANGLFVNEDRRRTARAALGEGPVLRIGRTRLRIREENYSVPSERVLSPRTHAWPIPVALAVLVLGGQLLSTWLQETGEPSLGMYVTPLVVLIILAVAWTAGWAIISRVFSGRTRFERHLLIALGALLVLWGLDELSNYGAYALSWRWLGTYEYLGQWTLLGCVCFLHLRQVTRSREGRRAPVRLMASVAAVLALGGIAVQTMTQLELAKNFDHPAYMRTLKPPFLRLARSETETRFFVDAQKLKAGIDRARSESPGAAFGYLPDDAE